MAAKCTYAPSVGDRVFDPVYRLEGFVKAVTPVAGKSHEWLIAVARPGSESVVTMRSSRVVVLERSGVAP